MEGSTNGGLRCGYFLYLEVKKPFPSASFRLGGGTSRVGFSSPGAFVYFAIGPHPQCGVAIAGRNTVVLSGCDRTGRDQSHLFRAVEDVVDARRFHGVTAALLSSPGSGPPRGAKCRPDGV